MLQIALAQMEVIPGRPDCNTQTMLSMITEARQNGAAIIIFPEMAIPGYLLGDIWEQAAFLRDCEEYGRQVIAAATDICVIFGNVAVDWDKKNEDGRIRKYNACFAAYQQQLLKPAGSPYPFRIKTLQPNYREFDDSRHFYSLRQLAAESERPLSDWLQPFTLKLPQQTLQLGCLLCEDGWSNDYSQDPLALMRQNSPLDLIVNLSCSPYTAGKNNKRNRVFAEQARLADTPLVYVNTIGLQNNGKTVYTFDGGSTAYHRSGTISTICAPFRETIAYVNFAALTGHTAPAAAVPPADDDIRNIYEALSFGLRRFLDSIAMKKVVIGVSGGIDSAVTAALYTAVLGPDNVLLVNMPSRYNSQTTKSLAARLAENLGCRYTVMPIQDVVDYTVKQLQTTPLENPASGVREQLTVSDFVTENIQARDRSARILAGIAAAFGGGFTCNANKTEMTVGYSTLYGDQSGFLAVLADLWKFQIYALAHYLNDSVFGKPVIPQEIIDLVPSAELSAAQSVDEGKGDPILYPYHDYLFRSFVEHWQRATPEDILSWYQAGILEKKIGCKPGLVSHYFATPAAFIEDLERWWKLYTGLAIAKRIQAPPVLAVSRRAFGFDHREAQNGTYFTLRYQQLKARLLAKTKN